jgi:hypothetical protein
VTFQSLATRTRRAPSTMLRMVALSACEDD